MPSPFDLLGRFGIIGLAQVETAASNTHPLRRPRTRAITVSEPLRPRILRLFGREIPMPASRIGRIVLGVLLIFLGFLGFLPILGFWMIPLGLFILSHDLAVVRRVRRRIAVAWEKRSRKRNGGGLPPA